MNRKPKLRAKKRKPAGSLAEKARNRVVGKRHKMPFDKEQSDDSGSEDFDDLKNYVEYDESKNEEIQVSFEVSIPNMDKDYFGIELYARNYLSGSPFNFVDLTNLLLGDEQSKEPNPFTSIIKVTDGDDQSGEKRPALGVAQATNNSTQQQTVDAENSAKLEESAPDDIMQEEDERDETLEETSEWEWHNDTYGVFGLIDYTKQKKCESLKQIRDYILSKCTDLKTKQGLKEIFDHGKLAIIFNERVLNLPVELAPQLHATLHEEIEEAIKEERCTFFKYYLILSRVYYNADDVSLQEKHRMDGGKNKKPKQRLLPQQRADCEQNHFNSKSTKVVNFIKPEEEFYYVRSKIAFSFSIINEHYQDSKTVALDTIMTNEALVMVIEREKIPKILASMANEFVPEQQQQQ